jgi:hypothetical protein
MFIPMWFIGLVLIPLFFYLLGLEKENTKLKNKK